MKAVKHVIAIHRALTIELVMTETVNAIVNQGQLESNVMNVLHTISGSQPKVALNAIAILLDQLDHNVMTEGSVRVVRMLREDVAKDAEKTNIIKLPVV
jgi:hypothetical protein